MRTRAHKTRTRRNARNEPGRLRGRAGETQPRQDDRQRVGGSLESKAWSGIGLVLGMLDNDRIGTLEQVRGELADDATWSSG